MSEGGQTFSIKNIHTMKLSPENSPGFTCLSRFRGRKAADKKSVKQKIS